MLRRESQIAVDEDVAISIARGLRHHEIGFGHVHNETRPYIMLGQRPRQTKLCCDGKVGGVIILVHTICVG